MIIALTRAEQDKIKALESKYKKLISDSEKKMKSLFDVDNIHLPESIEYTKDLPSYYTAPEYHEYKKNNDSANKNLNLLLDEWESVGSDDCKAARKEHLALIDEFNQTKRQLYRQFEKRHFDELNGDPDKIISDAKNQVTQLIKYKYEQKKRGRSENQLLHMECSITDVESLIEDTADLLKMHYDFFKDDPKNTEAMRSSVLDTIANSPYTRGEWQFTKCTNEKNILKTTSPGINESNNNILTKSPKTWLTPIDKVSGLAFDGAGSLYNTKLIGVEIGNRKTKKEILSMVSLDFSDKSIQITGKKELTPYDREVHDALVTLYIDGENDYITPQMIYRAMTGNPKAKLMPRQQEAISNSLNKLMYSRLIIKASKEECEAYGFDSFIYEGAVIQGEKVAATVKGASVIEVYHLLKEPILYTYAGKKNQIGRLDIKLLNSPVNKNEENIMLQSYLYRRILAIKSSNKLSPTIVYDTVYKQLNTEASSDGALRKKKLKVRNTIKKILDYWKEQSFIFNYSENKRKNEIISVTICCEK